MDRQVIVNVNSGRARMLRSWQLRLAIIALFGELMLGRNVIAQPLGSFNPNRHHMNFSGQPCLKIQGYPEPQAINTNIYEHWIRAINSCGESIKVQVCYHDTNECIVMTVPPFGQTQSMLGIFPALKSFRFDAKEQFLDR
jgi:hypothetical protein